MDLVDAVRANGATVQTVAFKVQAEASDADREILGALCDIKGLLSGLFEGRYQEWFTREEAAEYLRCSVDCVKGLERDGCLVAHRSSSRRLVRYRRADLDGCLRRMAVEL